jgi:DNA mismatch repair ATPase MutS
MPSRGLMTPDTYGKCGTEGGADGVSGGGFVTFSSILFRTEAERKTADRVPECFPDLNLDQVVEAITEAYGEYELTPFFYVLLEGLDAIRYRHDVMKDLEKEGTARIFRTFSEGMRHMRTCLAREKKMYYVLQKQRWFLEAVFVYCRTLRTLEEELRAAHPASEGLSALLTFLEAYLRSEPFRTLASEAAALREELAAVRYSLFLKGSTVRVRSYEGEDDYSAEVETTFARFRQGAVKSYLSSFPEDASMNHVEAKILDCVAELNRDLFDRVGHFSEANRSFLHETIRVFDREIHFYLAVLDYVQRFAAAGLTFCYPEMSDVSKECFAEDLFDVALGQKLLSRGEEMVRNSFHLVGEERIFVISGPNQGGKTTFARAFGQVHYLAALGCPVPATRACLLLCDRIFTHFEREENLEDLRGKLQDDLVRIRDILDRATGRSVLVLNEIFSSTTLADARTLGRRILERIMELDALCVCVTFIDELSLLGAKTVSMVSSIVPGDPTRRTFTIRRAPADGLAYALSLAEKYRLTSRALAERIRS